MSKLGIVLWATVFLGSQANVDAAGEEISKYTEQLATISRIVANRHIDQAIGKINERSAEVYQQVLSFGPQNGREKIPVTSSLMNKVSTHLQTFKSSGQHYIMMGKKKGIYFNDTECISYMNDYLNIINVQVLNLKNVLFYEVYNDATMWIGELLNIANSEKDKLNQLKVPAATCKGFECNNLSNVARNIYDGFLTETTKALKFYGSMAEGTAIVDKFQYNWNYHTDMGQEVLQLVYNCALNPKATATSP